MYKNTVKRIFGYSYYLFGSIRIVCKNELFKLKFSSLSHTGRNNKTADPFIRYDFRSIQQNR